MAWKVYNIHSGRIVKAGFDEEETAKDWLEIRRDLAPEDFLVEEMDDEEEEEWASREDDDDAVVGEEVAESDPDFVDPEDGVVPDVLGDDEDDEDVEEEADEEEEEDDY